MDSLIYETLLKVNDLVFFMGLELSKNSVKVLEKRYLLKDENGKIIETPEELFRRVARFVASAEGKESKYYEDKFYKILTNFEFLPNSPTLMNAGTELGQLAACFILKVEDDLASIFEAVKEGALIQQSGGGTGYCFSFLRPKGDFVKSTAGIASGPVSFMTAFDNATKVIKQGGKRRGANMGVLHVWHPDIERFVTAKQTPGVLENFNLSVAVDDKFMKAVEKNGTYGLINPRTKKLVRKINARKLFRLITYSAWKSAEPGILFMDTMNRFNPTPDYEIFATNPCAEVPMPDYESCNLGSINLEKFVELDWSKIEWTEKIDWIRLKETIRLAVRCLDNIVEINKYPLPQIKEMTLKHRRVGLGVMGFARVLSKIGVKYNSKLGYQVGAQLMNFINTEAKQMSYELAQKRGSFPGFSRSKLSHKYGAMRNATVTSIAPTGTISIIADTSTGIEPLFSLAFVKQVMEGKKLSYTDLVFVKVLKERGLYSKKLMKKVIKQGSIQKIKEIPKEIREVFVTSYDLKPEEHVQMQAAFQKYTNLAVSKTINLPFEAKVKDVEQAYFLAWKLGCKGITVYRDKSRKEQVLMKFCQRY
ncbi:adenosylcobalamin-dependent ribonucleoside-diphosphate reductase [Candidatus Micrarchaeota archaeon]|nr:adenosylcobalamin-dependent ribonucleoside-diphosphate reductase [Candidatus Micrarchaeota archaeon]